MARSKTIRRGVSLMEVLISCFVLSVGLLGVAALIPMGQMSLFDANKLDRGGHCGRAALHDVKARWMMNYRTWATGQSATLPQSTDTGIGLYVIDPLGLSQGLNPGAFPRINLYACANNAPPADSIFRFSDDLVFETSADRSVRPIASTSGPNGVLDSDGNYSWFCTVMPSLSEAAVPWKLKTQFDVSVAVVYKRGFTGNDVDGVPFEQVVQNSTFLVSGATAQTMPVAYGGGAFQPSTPVTVKENEWVLLVGAGQASWYRVVAAADTPGGLIALSGPDWNNRTSPNVTLVVIKGVIGVYSQSMELDRDPLWSKNIIDAIRPNSE